LRTCARDLMPMPRHVYLVERISRPFNG
jgi:hypothetical protein